MSDATLIRGFSFGEVVGGAFSVLFRNFILFFILALVFSAPVSFYPAYMPLPRSQGGFFAYLGGILLLQLISVTLTSATVVFGTVQTLRRRPAPVGTTLSHTFAVLFPALGVSIIVFIGVGLAAAVASIPMFLFGSAWFLVIPVVVALILIVRWWVSVPAVVVERGGVFDSIGRSTQLTGGYRWPIFGIILLFGVIQWVVGFIVGQAIGVDTMREPDMTFFIVDWVVYACFAALSACLAGVAYFGLRVQQEGVDIDQVASVFD